MPSVRISRVVPLVVAVTLPVFAQEAPNTTPADAAHPVATLRTTARIVVLDVVAVDSHGQPVKGLKPSDFTLSEDGVPQTLASFSERDAAADQPPPAPQPALPPNTFANHAPVVNGTAMTVLLFDTSDLNFSDAAYARDQAAAYLKTVKPGTPMCVFDLDHWGGLRLIQDFTTDAAVLRKAVESKSNAQKPVNPHFTPNLRTGPAMRELAGYLAGFPGRKNLIWFTGVAPELRMASRGGLFSGMTSSDDQSFARDLKDATPTLTLSRVALYTVDPRGVIFDWNLEANILLQDAIFDQGADASEAAKASGVKAFYDTNGIKQVVGEIMATGSHYYTVSYKPSNVSWDGSFRKVQVHFANSVTSTGVSTAKLKLEYRNGYYALNNARRLSTAAPDTGTRRMISYSPKGDPSRRGETADPLQQAMGFGAIPPFQVLFRAHVQPETAVEKLKRQEQRPPGNFLHVPWMHEPFRTYRIHYSVDPEDIQFTQAASGSYRDTIQFVAVLYDSYGTVVNSFISTEPLDVSAGDLAQIRQTGLGIDLQIAVPTKGDFYLRLAVQDVNSGHVGALEVPVSEIKVTSESAAAASPKGY